MKIRLKTLTPVHIGTGKELTPIDFFNNARIDYDRLFDLIVKSKQEEFYNWLDTVDVKSFSVNNIQKTFNIKSQDILNNCGLYRFNQSFRDKVKEAIKDTKYELFIPGSSLKGAIRTALMYKVLKSKPGFVSSNLKTLREQVNSLLKQRERLNSLKKSTDEKFVQEVFICGVQKEINNKLQVVYSDQKYDLLKLLYVSDSTSVKTFENGEISDIKLYVLGKGSPHSNFPLYTESISKDVTLEFDVKFDIEFLKEAKKLLKENDVHFGKTYYIRIEEKLKYLFGIDLLNDNDFSEEKIINAIISALLEYGSATSEIEKKWIESISSTTNNMEKLKQLYNTRNKFKIGFGTGLTGMTMLPLLISDPKLKQQAFDLFKLLNIGKHRNGTPLNIDEFPFSRRFNKDGEILDGFGWVAIVGFEDQVEQEQNIQQRNPSPRPPNSLIAEIVNDISKPPKVKILEGEHQGEETILPQVNLKNLGLGIGSKVYITLHFQKDKIQKAEYKGKVE